jgi:sugar fermentation stimulation protein A
MLFPRPLVRGRLVQRYKRFFADVELDEGGLVTAHVANPGAMLGLKDPGTPAWLQPVDDPKRSLRFTLEMMEHWGGLVGVNTMHPNRLAAEAIAADAIPELSGYATARREVKYDTDSRIDILLEDAERPRAWVEVKNVHLSRQSGLAEFPDCVAARSTKHLKALERRVAAGERAVVLFIVQRTDCDAFSACAELDPAFAAGLAAAADAGVEVLVYACRMGTERIELARRIKWKR